MTDAALIGLAIIIMLAIIGGWEISRKRRTRGSRRRIDGPGFKTVAKLPYQAMTATKQLETVMSAQFQPRPLMSKGESSIFYAAQRAMKRLDIKGHVMAQVCLGEILRSPNDDAFRAINSKRVDVLIVSTSGLPMVAIEHQGEGHYQGNAYARDAVKKAALQRAGIAYMETTPQHSAEDIERDLARIMQTRLVPA